MIGVGFAEGPELARRAGVFKAAPGIHVGEDHCLLGAKDLGGVGHELDPAKRDHVGIGRRRLARQFKAVAHEVGDVLNVGRLIVMREDHRVLLLTEAVDFGEQVGAGGVAG